MRCRLPPFLLGLQHVQRATDDEATATDDLRNPVRSVEPPLRSQMIGNAWQGREASDAKDSGTEELGGSGEETQFMEVVRAQVMPGRVPLPLPLAA